MRGTLAMVVFGHGGPLLLKFCRIAGFTILLIGGWQGASAAQDSGLGADLGIGSCVAGGMTRPRCDATNQAPRSRDVIPTQQMPTSQALNQTASTTSRRGQSTVASSLE